LSEKSEKVPENMQNIFVGTPDFLPKGLVLIPFFGSAKHGEL
jgi:hypothetical protein